MEHGKRVNGKIVKRVRKLGTGDRILRPPGAHRFLLLFSLLLLLLLLFVVVVVVVVVVVRTRTIWVSPLSWCLLVEPL